MAFSIMSFTLPTKVSLARYIPQSHDLVHITSPVQKQLELDQRMRNDLVIWLQILARSGMSSVSFSHDTADVL